jgi:hypothetical protein
LTLINAAAAVIPHPDTISSANKPSVSNPLNIDCRDLYPLITRTFTLAF